jgi:aspartate aminotransferase-like enzyme
MGCMTTHPAWMLFASRCSAACDRLAPIAPGVVAVAGVLALLLAFQQVVAAGVENSQARHRASAARADATWRCNALQAAVQRTDCRAQLDAAVR